MGKSTKQDAQDLVALLKKLGKKQDRKEPITEQEVVDEFDKSVAESAEKGIYVPQNTFIEQLRHYIAGETDKTELGKTWDLLMTSAGPFFKQFFTISGIAERTKNGESFLGSLPIFGGGVDENGNKIPRGNLVEYQEQVKSQKEKAKKEKENKALAKAIADALTK